MVSRMTDADWCCVCGNVPCNGLDCGAYLLGHTPRKKPAPKPPQEISDIRKRAWVTRRAALATVTPPADTTEGA